jgi:tripartite-type tricarboxylate transporter receptor subunit TctC
MNRSALRLFAHSFALLAFTAGLACAQEYPSKPVRILTAEAGGTPDLISRLVGQGIAPALGQPVVVDNRVIFVGAEILSKAAADGYTLGVKGSNLWILPFLKRVPWDPLRDFVPITLVSRAPNVLVVHPSVPVKSVEELVAAARASPGKFNYGTGGPGSSNHLAAELFKSMANVNIVCINYKGTGPSINGLMGGEVQVMFAGLGPISPHMKAGRVRALGVTTAQASALVPGVPPIASFLPGYESTVQTGMFAPARTPPAIIARVNREVVHVLAKPEVKERLFNLGIEPIGNSPEEFAAIIKADMAIMGKVIKEAGIHD